MSSDGVDHGGRTAVPELDRLELTVRRLLDEHEALRRRAHAAEKRIRELEGSIAQLSPGKGDPVQLADKARAVEKENQALHKRLELARDAVRRIQARLQLVEEDRS